MILCHVCSRKTTSMRKAHVMVDTLVCTMSAILWTPTTTRLGDVKLQYLTYCNICWVVLCNTIQCSRLEWARDMSCRSKSLGVADIQALTPLGWCSTTGLTAWFSIANHGQEGVWRKFLVYCDHQFRPACNRWTRPMLLSVERLRFPKRCHHASQAPGSSHEGGH